MGDYPRTLPISRLRAGDLVRITVDRVSNNGNPVVGENGQMVVRGDLSAGEEVVVEIRQMYNPIIATATTYPEEATLPRVTDKSGENGELLVKASRGQWQQWLEKRKRESKQVEERKRKAREEQRRRREEKKKRADEISEEIQQIAERKQNTDERLSPQEIADNMGVNVVTESKEETVNRNGEDEHEKRNMNSLLNDRG